VSLPVFVVAVCSCESRIGVQQCVEVDTFNSSDDDLAAFQEAMSLQLNRDTMSHTHSAYEETYHYAMVPLELSLACRKLHSALTGPKARQQSAVDVNSLYEVWGALAKLWNDFDNLRTSKTFENIHQEEVDRYIHGWQVSKPAASHIVYLFISFLS
jgi:hypothetical protein